MIDKESLARIAKLNGLKPWQQEKHYIQAIVLTILAEEPIVFKGGTYLWFFHGLQRFSEDLDFTAFEETREDLAEDVSKGLELFGVENSLKKIADDAKTLSFRLSARGPLNTAAIDECRVFVEISKREQVVLKPLPLKLDFPAYQLPVKRAMGMRLEEVGAEKLRAIMFREKARDLFDLFFLIKAKQIGFNKELVNQKLSYYGASFSFTKLKQKISRIQAHYESELKSIVFSEIPEFKECKKTIENWAKTSTRSKAL